MTPKNDRPEEWPLDISPEKALKEQPQVPGGYFDSLTPRIMGRIRSEKSIEVGRNTRISLVWTKFRQIAIPLAAVVVFALIVPSIFKQNEMPSQDLALLANDLTLDELDQLSPLHVNDLLEAGFALDESHDPYLDALIEMDIDDTAFTD